MDEVANTASGHCKSPHVLFSATYEGKGLFISRRALIVKIHRCSLSAVIVMFWLWPLVALASRAGQVRMFERGESLGPWSGAWLFRAHLGPARANEHRQYGICVLVA